MRNSFRQTISPLVFVLVLFLAFISCGNNKSSSNPVAPSFFAKGADVSWLTQMEANGVQFYNSSGESVDCMTLLKDLGTNAIRLRVWVNPLDGWCNSADVLAKAKRAKNLGLRILIDFHYSDSWADPSQQTKPSAWKNLSFVDLKSALRTHTTEVLTLLKVNDIFPDWVQVGNETGNGMLWEDGKAALNMSNYAQLSNEAYDAVKSIFPNTKVIVHLQNGQDNSLFRWLFDGLKKYGGKWDVIGMSLYPTADHWQAMNDSCVLNMKDMISRYGSEVMLCEVGMNSDAGTSCNLFLADLMAKMKDLPSGSALGLFYWEPECYNNWNGYVMGAFDSTGKPTVALQAYKKQ